MRTTFYTRVGKRWFDAVTSFAGLVLISPMLLCVTVVIRLTSSGPVIFRQIRTGRFGKPFEIVKFRTMKVSPAGANSLLTSANDPRITAVGRWLRKTKIDELPQLYNVLLGDMSLVGPRPEVPHYAMTYTEEQKRVLLVCPGITGPSIIINEEDLMAHSVLKEEFYVSKILPAKLEVDLAYCDNIRFLEDIRLVLLTLFRLGSHEEACASATDEIRHLAGAKRAIKQRL